jgi:hypothetical protein
MVVLSSLEVFGHPHRTQQVVGMLLTLTGL